MEQLSVRYGHLDDDNEHLSAANKRLSGALIKAMATLPDAAA